MVRDHSPSDLYENPPEIERLYTYTEMASFICFIEEKYGLKKVLEAYGDVALYKTILGNRIEDDINEWTEYLESYY